MVAGVNQVMPLRAVPADTKRTWLALRRVVRLQLVCWRARSVVGDSKQNRTRFVAESCERGRGSLPQLQSKPVPLGAHGLGHQRRLRRPNWHRRRRECCLASERFVRIADAVRLPRTASGARLDVEPRPDATRIDTRAGPGQASWSAVAVSLRKQGWTISAIARHLDRDRKTVRACLSGERQPGVRRAAGPDPLDDIADRRTSDVPAWRTAPGVERGPSVSQVREGTRAGQPPFITWR